MKNFENEVNMNRPRMALAELVPIIKSVFQRISELEDKVDRLLAQPDKAEDKEETPKAEEKPAPAKKPRKSTAKKSTAKETSTSE